MRLTLQHFNAMLSPHPWTIDMGRELGNMKFRSGPYTVKDQNIISLKSIWRSLLRRFHLFAFRCVIYLELSRWSQWPLGNFWASWRQDPTIIFTHTKKSPYYLHKISNIMIKSSTVRRRTHLAALQQTGAVRCVVRYRRQLELEKGVSWW